MCQEPTLSQVGDPLSAGSKGFMKAVCCFVHHDGEMKARSATASSLSGERARGG